MAPSRPCSLPDPCASCDATCCRNYAIYLLPQELERIAAHVGEPPAAIVDVETRDLARDMPAAYLDGMPSQLILAVGEDGEACLLLDPETRRCTVHRVRPYVCRMYPFAGDPGDPVRIRPREDVYCPGDFPLGPLEEQALRETYEQFWLRDLDDYRRQVQRWNLGGAPGGLAEFLAFCRGEP